MRPLVLTALVVAAGLAASPARAQLPLPPVPSVDVPGVPVPVPTLEVPELPLPLPLPLPEVVLPVPTPAGPGAPVAPVAQPAPATQRPAPAAEDASPRQGGAPAAPSRPATAPAPARDGGSPTARRRRPRTGSPRERAAPRRVFAPLPAVAPVASPRAPASREPETAAGPASRIADELEDLARIIPAQILWALLGMMVLALALAGNAYWQSRRRAALEVEREALLGDVGLLSSALLPALPDDLEGLAVTAAYRPADGPAAGGDFYDVFTLGAGRAGVVLGDVSGHGRHSVRQAALARYTLRTLLAAGQPPGEALAQADRMLARELAPDFVTVIVAVYDAAKAELTYAKAGHPPPIVLGAPHDPGAEEPACPLGLGLGEAWPEYRVELKEGVTVCLFTDGLEDARAAGVRLGREGVQRLLAAQEAPDAAGLLAGVRELADSVADDTAAVVLRSAQPAAGTGSGRTTTVSSTSATSSAGMPVR